MRRALVGGGTRGCAGGSDGAQLHRVESSGGPQVAQVYRMPEPRWHKVDLQPATPHPRETGGGASEQAASGPDAILGPGTGARPGDLAAARAHYRLRAFDAAAALASAAYREGGHPEAARLAGLALAQGDAPAAALPLLRQALLALPDDHAVRAALLAVELGEGSPGEEPPAETPALRELAAARAWVLGQRLAAERCYAEAEHRFTEAGAGFAAHLPPHVLPPCLAAAYVGQALCALLAGNPEAAQRAYSRLPLSISEPALGALARQVYLLAEALRELPVPERAPAAAPLAFMLSGLRLRVRYLDPAPSAAQPGAAVLLRWELRGEAFLSSG